jgi:hypothetical protein
MDSILRLLILTLFVTVTFSLGYLDPDVLEHKLFPSYSGTIGSYPSATQANTDPFTFSGYPGLAHISIAAVSSVAVCVSPYAAVTSNLQTQCPTPTVNFYYTGLDIESEFLLFLDDFSMNFMGRDGRSSGVSNKKSDQQGPSIPPYTPQSATISLLQNIPYFVSIGLIDDNGANSTEREIIDFTIYSNYPKCSPGSVPNIEFATKNTSEPCIHLEYELSPTNTSSTPLTVSQSKPIFFSFNITTLTLLANLDFHVNSLEFNLSIYIGYGYVPNENSYDYSFQNSSFSLGDSDLTAEFLGDIIQSFSYSIANPKVGTYYAKVQSGLINETNFGIEFNTTTCDLASNNTCGNFVIPYVLSSNQTVQTINLTSQAQYISVFGQNISLGIATANTSSVFYQVDVNAIPNMNPMATPPPFKQAKGSTVAISLSSPQEYTYVFGFSIGDGIVLPQDSQDVVQALLWTGSTCPGNCSNVGDCNPTTFQCNCYDGYSGPYCDVSVNGPSSPPSPPGTPSPPGGKKKFKTLYIILIIIGGAILLAVLIGVPVALFLNNRKKARYERV